MVKRLLRWTFSCGQRATKAIVQHRVLNTPFISYSNSPLFMNNLTAVRSYAHRHKIPTKREYGCTYYSQSHFDELRRTDLLSNENYYSVEQVQQLNGLTKANICHIVKVKHIEKTKVGRLNLLLRSDVERVMEERKTSGMMAVGF